MTKECRMTKHEVRRWRICEGPSHVRCPPFRVLRRCTLKPERCSWSSRSAAFMPLHCGNIGGVGSSKASPYSVNAKRHECRAPAAGACSFTRVGACLTESFRLQLQLQVVELTRCAEGHDGVVRS